MNFNFIYDSGASLIVTTVILVVIGLGIIGGVIGFLITLKKERAYAQAALPELESPEEEEVVVEDDDMQVLAESVFVMDEEEAPVLDDMDSNRLMADIDKAKRVDEKAALSQNSRGSSLTKLTNVFKKKN